MKKSKLSSLFGFLGFLACAVPSKSIELETLVAKAEQTSDSFIWSAPTTGSPVHHYMAYTRVRDPVSGDWSDSLILVPFRSEVNPEITIITSGYPIFTNSMSIDMGGLQYRLAVSGVDSLGREGPKSLESEVAGEPPEYAVSGPSVDLSDTNSVKNMIYWYLEHPEAIQQKEKIEPKIYPNPSNNAICINYPNLNPLYANVYDLLGRKINDKPINLDEFGQGFWKIPDDVSSGTYLIFFESRRKEIFLPIKSLKFSVIK